MSSVEVIGGAGVVPVGERVESESILTEDRMVHSPERPADTEIALRSTEVYLPVDPVSINGTLYNVAVDQTNLKTAINTVAEDHLGWPYLYPRQLHIGIGWGKSLVEIGQDLQPKSSDPSADNRIPILTTFKGGGTSVNVTIPGEVDSEDYTEAGLVELVTRQANKDLWVALSQNQQAKRKRHLGLRISSIALAMGAGEGTGIALANTSPQMLGYGLGGTAVGALVALGIQAWNIKFIWGGAKNSDSHSVIQSSNYKKINWNIEELPKEGLVISLEPVQPEEVEE